MDMRRKEKLKEYISAFADIVIMLGRYPKPVIERILWTVLSNIDEDYLNEFFRYVEILEMRKKIKEMEKRRVWWEARKV